MDSTTYKYHSSKDESPKSTFQHRTYYELKLWVPDNLRKYYTNAMKKHNAVVLPYINGANTHFDAGFDLFCPEMVVADSMKTTKINHLVRSSMSKIENVVEHFVEVEVEVEVDENNLPLVQGLPVGYYLYPRSSTGTKTPLRLANSVGIIDSGYRGDIIAAFDNWSTNDYVIDAYTRVVQLCPPDLSYPLYVRLVTNVEDLGHTTRGTGGFGSTGV